MFQVAAHVGKLLRDTIAASDLEWRGGGGFGNVHRFDDRRRADRERRTAPVPGLSEGNFIEASFDTPFSRSVRPSMVADPDPWL